REAGVCLAWLDGQLDRRRVRGLQPLGDLLRHRVEPVGQRIGRGRALLAHVEPHFGLRPQLAARVRERDQAGVTRATLELVGGFARVHRLGLAALLPECFALRREARGGLRAPGPGRAQAGHRRDDADRELTHCSRWYYTRRIVGPVVGPASAKLSATARFST